MSFKHIKIIGYNALRNYRDSLLRCISGFFCLFPIKKRKVVLSNFNGRGFGDNPKYIANVLHELKGVELIWISSNRDDVFPPYIKTVKHKSIKSLYHVSTAKVWIDNARKDPFYVKRKEQYYLQTWHGSVALKRIEKDVENSLGEYYVNNAKQDARMTDLMISDSKFTDNLYRRSFWYNGEIKRLGSPRIDCLFQENRRKEIREKMNLGDGQFVVLYAPTFRNSLRLDVYDLDISVIKETFEKKIGKPVVVLFRMHPNLTWIVKDRLLDDVIDVTQYPDVYELLLAGDALITDYSTLMFEFPVVSAKPVFCYAKDMDEYDRGFYFNLDQLPFLFARTNEELVAGINAFDQNAYQKKLSAFYEEIELLADGHASERVVDYILNAGWLDGGKR